MKHYLITASDPFELDGRILCLVVEVFGWMDCDGRLMLTSVQERLFGF
jgi:hypothetical protein